MAKESVFLLTTVDNPYNPFTDFIPWYMEDLRLGYDTCGLLARMTLSSDRIDNEDELAAMRDIVRDNYSGKHIIVTEDTFDILINIDSI